ncbi:dipeptide/oligopeptide/nickel ABC transporter ATP-binding protein [Sulfodiicoccus acidiphilus]|uniref:Dipeptide/oligopeptide/nickel ABC transporter ATP-binding protein n=1 Tax=Sulfodiicoccus acidiphilus TaxID=1670455 RepID=A0A348B5V4_9CREN|nr:ABC transporter ATP-binding protein [Sulfodiicoccus acidiphilus]BBD73556.1 dipeptide/oligopeptide/nickel ABC transporter ATP-binding protein [Sulfodiicoccus acidiphilus]GGT92328.1 dipeptide/oligopeptide/nickel ABC transporter ATP-binding protein [Sulfodiicoccus acidiphilus]
MPLLDVRELTVAYVSDGREVEAVRDLSFSVEKGESLAVVGESGSGKTTLAMTLMGLLPKEARVKRGDVVFDGVSLLSLGKEELRRIRWRRMSMIFQASQNALDPVRKVGNQLVELYTYHNRGARKEEAVNRAIETLSTVNLAPSVMDMYPHELSGGMKQRVVIAASLLLEPELLLADEPTTALDVVTQAEILLLIRKVVKERGLTLLFITHDVGLVASLCDRVMVMYGGTDMEQGPLREVLSRPAHPYTERLIKTLRGLEEGRLELEDVKREVTGGCPFLSRCPDAVDRCYREFPSRREKGKVEVRCFVRGGES